MACKTVLVAGLAVILVIGYFSTVFGILAEWYLWGPHTPYTIAVHRSDTEIAWPLPHIWQSQIPNAMHVRRNSRIMPGQAHDGKTAHPHPAQAVGPAGAPKAVHAQPPVDFRRAIQVDATHCHMVPIDTVSRR